MPDVKKPPRGAAFSLQVQANLMTTQGESRESDVVDE